MISALRRSSFRFSLRTLFAVFLVLALPLGWIGVQLKWIRDRNEARAWIRHHGYLTFDGPDPYKKAPLSIDLFGEQGVVHIELDAESFPPEELQTRVVQIKRLFPETQLSTRTKNVILQWSR